MRRALAILIAFLFIVPELPARNKDDWSKVERLKPDTPVQIWLRNNDRLSGQIQSVTGTGIRLKTFDPAYLQTDNTRELDRGSIRKIVRIRHPKLPDPVKWMATGAVVGGAVGTLSGGIYDATHHGEKYHWFLGGFGGAVIGFFASCVVLTGIGAVDTARAVHHPVVYESK